MNRVQRFVAGLGALTPFAAAGKLVTICLCLLVGSTSLARLVENVAALVWNREVVPGQASGAVLVRETLLSAGVLVVCLVVVAGLFSIVTRAGEAGGAGHAPGDGLDS